MLDIKINTSEFRGYFLDSLNGYGITYQERVKSSQRNLS